MEDFKVFAQDRFQQRHPHCLVLQMRPLKGCSAHFPDFKKKMRSPATIAEGSHQMSHAGVAAHLSSSRPAFQQPSREAAVAFDVVEYVECDSRW